MRTSIFILMICAGLFPLPMYVGIGAEWVQVAGVVLAFICGGSAVGLFVNYSANEVIRLRRTHYQATVGIQLDYAQRFVNTLRYLTTSQTKELFDLALLTAQGLPGMPIVWMVQFPGGHVGLSVLKDFMDACIEIYDEREGVHELWPVRDHARAHFGVDSEQELRVITEWLCMEGLALPARGNRAATWADGTHPLDVKRGLGLDV
jgi:hypothetical protein